MSNIYIYIYIPDCIHSMVLMFGIFIFLVYTQIEHQNFIIIFLLFDHSAQSASTKKKHVSKKTSSYYSLPSIIFINYYTIYMG